MLDAFCSAERTTFVGSTTPSASMSPYSAVAALNPKFPSASWTLATTTEPSIPAFSAIARTGDSRLRRIILRPVSWSPSNAKLSSEAAARRSAIPPPGTIPSSIAARVAASASSNRAFFSFISTSVAAPTLTTATPPASFASRSSNFSRSYSEVVSSICLRICSTLPSTFAFAPLPPTIVVLSLSMTTRRAAPSIPITTFSKRIPVSSEMT